MNKMNICLLIIVLVSLCSACTSPMNTQSSKQPSDEKIQQILGLHAEAVQRLTTNHGFKKVLTERNASTASPSDNLRFNRQFMDGNPPQELLKTLLENVASKHIEFRVNKTSNVYNRGYLLDQHGRLAGMFPKTNRFLFGNQPIFKKAFASGKGNTYVSPRKFDKVSKTATYWIAAPVRNDETVMGVLVMGIKANHVVHHAMEDQMLKHQNATTSGHQHHSPKHDSHHH